MRIHCLMPLVLAVVAARSADAQFPTSARVPIENRSYVAFNPMGVPFDIFTGEVESGVAQGVTLGGVASHLDVDAKRYTSVDFKFRYYPGEVVLRGFSLGGTLGYLNYSEPTFDNTPNGPRETRTSIASPTIGIITDYNWLLGSEHRFVVGTGLGAKRVLASSDDRNRVGLDRAYLTARFVVGLAF